jgi:TrpR-related protein YerC/YecD
LGVFTVEEGQIYRLRPGRKGSSTLLTLVGERNIIYSNRLRTIYLFNKVNKGEGFMTLKWKDELTEQFAKGILELENVEEVYSFLEDVATIGEIRALAQRLEVARLLDEGYTYPQIAQQTGASTATISRVKKFLEYGADGYRVVLERIKIK